jgi:hypothetical protein
VGDVVDLLELKVLELGGVQDLTRLCDGGMLVRLGKLHCDRGPRDHGGWD